MVIHNLVFTIKVEWGPKKHVPTSLDSLVWADFTHIFRGILGENIDKISHQWTKGWYHNLNEKIENTHMHIFPYHIHIYCKLCWCHKGPDSIQRWHLASIGNPIVEIRRSYDPLISTMGFPILVRWHLYIESGPRVPISWVHATNSP